VEASGIPPTLKDTPREFVDDEDLPAFYHVVLVAAEKRLRAERFLEIVDQARMLGVE
jgi:hypothetical protein